MNGVTGTQRTHPAGRVIIQVNAALTAVFVVTSLAAAVVFDNPWKQVAVGTSLACFAVGVQLGFPEDAARQRIAYEVGKASDDEYAVDFGG